MVWPPGYYLQHSDASSGRSMSWQTNSHPSAKSHRRHPRHLCPRVSTVTATGSVGGIATGRSVRRAVPAKRHPEERRPSRRGTDLFPRRAALLWRGPRHCRERAGVQSRNRIRQSGGWLTGEGMASAGPSCPRIKCSGSWCAGTSRKGSNRGDWSVCVTTLADDYTAYYGSEGKANVGRDEYVRVCRFLRTSFRTSRSRSKT
jgi:hypothetical protein